MILGLGTDVCPARRWQHLMERFGEKALRRVLAPEEADYLLRGNRARLPERAAGRWALREAFGKALGVGLDGWSWKQLRYLDGKLWAEGELAVMIQARGIDRIHGSVTHDGGTAFAVVLLEGADLDERGPRGRFAPSPSPLVLPHVMTGQSPAITSD